MPTQRKRLSEQHWRERIADQQQSGLSQEAYCEVHDLALSTFCFWRAQIRQMPEPQASAFVELPSAPLPGPRWEIELHLGDGLSLRLRRA